VFNCAPHQYPVELTPGQRERLTAITRTGSAPAAKLRHAQVLLLSDGGRPGGRLTRAAIAAALGMHVNTVDRIRKRFVREGEAPALDRKPRLAPPTPPKLDGRAEAVLVAVCCGPAPGGRARWTLQLLADELARRRVVTRVCAETVRQRLKKIASSPGGSGAGACPSATAPGSSPRWNRSSTPTRRPPARAPR
jgi:transposase